VRYADDFVIFARSEAEAAAALETARGVLEGELGLALHPEKTRVTTVAAGFEFLGYHWHWTRAGVLAEGGAPEIAQRFRRRCGS